VCFYVFLFVNTARVFGVSAKLRVSVFFVVKQHDLFWFLHEDEVVCLSELSVCKLFSLVLCGWRGLRLDKVGWMLGLLIGDREGVFPCVQHFAQLTCLVPWSCFADVCGTLACTSSLVYYL